MLEIKNYNTHSIEYNLPIKLLDKIVLSESLEASSRETLFIKDICKRIKKSKSVLYVLKNDDDIIGLIALSVTSIEEQPSLQIDYILVDKKHQGKDLEILDNCKPFRYLIEFAIDLAESLQPKIGLRYIVLSPDNDNLKEKYNKVGFQNLNNEWMYLKI